MLLLLKTLRCLFHLLYHPFAWTYDLVAASVSLGRWKQWVFCCLPHLRGERILELGHGPGHLQVRMQQEGYQVFGLDESRQMGRQARRTLRRSGGKVTLARGLAQALPYPAASFDSAVATFPSEYIYDPQSLREVRRVLKPGGRLVVLPMAWITGASLPDRFAAWLFRLTGEAVGAPGSFPAWMRTRFHQAGFRLTPERVRLPTSEVLVLVAEVV